MASKTVTLKNNNGDQIHPKTKANAVFLEDGQSVENKFKTIGQGFSGSYNDLTDKPELFSGSYNDLTEKPTIPTTLSELTDDTTHRLVTDTEKNVWNNKSDFNGSYDNLTDKPSIPTVSTSVSSSDTTTAASSSAVKSAYDLANSAMPKTGGTFTGSVTFNQKNSSNVNNEFLFKGNIRVHSGSNPSSAIIKIGDGDHIYIKEPIDDYLLIYARHGITMQGVNGDSDPVLTINGSEPANKYCVRNSTITISTDYPSIEGEISWEV